jgi:hypothetical protein
LKSVVHPPVRLDNTERGAFTNLVIGLTVPPELGLEQGRTDFEMHELRSGAQHEHVLRLRPPGPAGRFSIDVRNLSFRNEFGRAERLRGRTLLLEVEPADEQGEPHDLVVDHDPLEDHPRSLRQ